MSKAKVSAPSVRRMTAEDRRWQAENDLRTMQQFAELKASPQRMKSAQDMLHKQMSVLVQVKKK